MATTKRFDVKDRALASEGVRRIQWADRQMPVLAIKGEDNDTYYSHIEAAVDHKPHLTMDDGADVIGVLHSARREQLGDIIAGTEVMPMEQAAKIGDIFCTATGDKSVIRREHYEAMKDGAILANTGHFNVELDIQALRSIATEVREARAFVEEFTLADGRRLYLLGDGRLINLAAAEGHPALVMDMSFANQALAAEYAVQNAGTLERRVYPVPEEIDNEIARLKLETMGVDIDQLTEEQASYLASWDEGT